MWQTSALDVRFVDLCAAGVSIAAGKTFESFHNADNDLELCAELTDDKIIRQFTEDSDDSNSDIKQAAPIKSTSSELMRALMTLSLVYSNGIPLAEIEADIITSKRNAMQKEINNNFQSIDNEITSATSKTFFFLFFFFLTNGSFQSHLNNAFTGLQQEYCTPAVTLSTSGKDQ